MQQRAHSGTLGAPDRRDGADSRLTRQLASDVHLVEDVDVAWLAGPDRGTLFGHHRSPRRIRRAVVRVIELELGAIEIGGVAGPDDTALGFTAQRLMFSRCRLR